MLLANPVPTVISLVVFLGLFWLISGIIEVIFSLFLIGEKGSKWGLKLVAGIIGILAGIFVLNHPLYAGIITPVILMYFIAFTFIFHGIVYMVAGSEDREKGEYEWSWGSLFLGIFYLIFGFVLLIAPVLVSTSAVVIASAILAIVGGIGLIIFAFKVKSAVKEA